MGNETPSVPDVYSVYGNFNIQALYFGLTILLLLMEGCSAKKSQKKEMPNATDKMEKGTFGYDVQFLQQHTDMVILKDSDSLGRILVTPTMQGRVMTSTVAGDSGKSLGWVNHELIKSGDIKEHFTPYGGEDRFWIAPEGGQYSVFIAPGKEMIFDNWYVPRGVNTEPWNLVSKTDTLVTVEKDLHLTNYSNTPFDLHVRRSLRMFNDTQTEDILGIQIPDIIKKVAYESENTIRNTGDQAWTKETGTISIWILSMFTPAPGTTIAIPYKHRSEEELGPIVTTDYFGEISSDRLKIKEGIIYFKVDGKKRRKLGVSPRRALPVAGSYDKTNNILTIIRYTAPKDETDYMNQLWKQQEKPYGGNLVYAYNDGPLEDGRQLGPFYEMESSSPAAVLVPGKTLTHHHQVFHFTGGEKVLTEISKNVLGIGIDEIATAFDE